MKKYARPQSCYEVTKFHGEQKSGKQKTRLRPLLRVRLGTCCLQIQTEGEVKAEKNHIPLRQGKL